MFEPGCSNIPADDVKLGLCELKGDQRGPTPTKPGRFCVSCCLSSENAPAVDERAARYPFNPTRREDAGRWLLSEARAGESAAIEPLGTSLDVDAVYANPLER